MNDKIQKTRLLALAMSIVVAFSCFVLGALWVRSLHNSMDEARLQDAGREIRGKMTVIRQVVLADMAALPVKELFKGVPPALPDKNFRYDLSRVSESLNEQFDVVTLFNEGRTYVGGGRRIGKEKDRQIVPLTSELVKIWIPADSGFFDRAASDGFSSGLLAFEGRPLVVGIKLVKISEEQRAFVLAGRWLDPRRLAPTAGLAENAFDIFVPDERVGMPGDVESAKIAMTSDTQFFGKLQRRGAGVGYLRFDDVFERTAFILRFPWVDSSGNGERKSLIWLFAASLLLGVLLHVSTSMSLTWIDRQRRRSPGIGGMTELELREMVESFPGYAFALNQKQQYIAVSRALAGVSGKESVNFAGRLFGSVSGEAGMQPDSLLNDMSVSKHWPVLKPIYYEISGLRERFTYQGVCHFVAGRRILFVVLQSVDAAASSVVRPAAEISTPESTATTDLAA